MKTNYITPAVASIRIVAEKEMAEQSGLSGNNQIGDGNQLSKEIDFFEEEKPVHKDIWGDEE